MEEGIPEKNESGAQENNAVRNFCKHFEVEIWPKRYKETVK